MLWPLLCFASALLYVHAQTCPANSNSSWRLSSIRRMIAFGDSYTDESRLQYMIEHEGTSPPPGTTLPESPFLRNWARHVAIDTGVPLHNYAVSGAVCSNNITPRPFPPIHGNFPPVLENEIPAYLAERTALKLDVSAAVIALMVGTNDMGNIAFLTDSQVDGKVLRDYTRCLFDALDQLYASGGRNFLLFNAAPLHLAPQYADASRDGRTATQYWPDKPSNLTALSRKMEQQTTSANEILRYQVPYEVLVAGRYPGASIALFDLWQLLSNIYATPAEYLNQSVPVRVTDHERHCDTSGDNCEYEYDNTNPDAFMWWDELHPSEQVHKIIAREVIETLDGRSRYATYW
jgi:phospholipase/lecithinase/hemolysin